MPDPQPHTLQDLLTHCLTAVEEDWVYLDPTPATRHAALNWAIAHTTQKQNYRRGGAMPYVQLARGSRIFFPTFTARIFDYAWQGFLLAVPYTCLSATKQEYITSLAQGATYWYVPNGPLRFSE